MITVKVTLTDEQEKAITRSLLSAFPDENNRPTFEQFVDAGAQDKANEHVLAWKQRDLDAVKSELQPEDLAEVAAIIQKRKEASK